MATPLPLNSRNETVELLQSGYRYALSLTHHKENAEDIVQEAFLKLHRRYGGIPAKPLLMITVRRLFIDRLRQHQRDPVLEVVEADDAVAVPAAESGTHADLESLLSQLRPIEREALYLHHVEGYTAQQIAELTETPRNSVLSLLSRGLRKLQTAVSQTY